MLRSAKDGTLTDSLEVTNDRDLGPVHAIGGATAQECAVASVARLNKIDQGIGEDPRSCLREKADEWIILGEKNQ